jgi:hypothetical protein
MLLFNLYLTFKKTGCLKFRKLGGVCHFVVVVVVVVTVVLIVVVIQKW